MIYRTVEAFNDEELAHRAAFRTLPEETQAFLEEVFTDFEELLAFKDNLSANLADLDARLPEFEEAANDNEPELKVHPESLKAQFPGNTGITGEAVAEAQRDAWDQLFKDIFGAEVFSQLKVRDSQPPVTNLGLKGFHFGPDYIFFR